MAHDNFFMRILLEAKMINIKVEEFTTPVLYTINYEENLDSALNIMRENSIRHLPVTSGEKVIGIVSERDILANYGKDWSQFIKVEDIMSEDILTVNVNDNLGEVAFQLSSNKIGSALVLDEASRIYGIFTTTDALNALVEIMYPDANRRSDLEQEY